MRRPLSGADATGSAFADDFFLIHRLDFAACTSSRPISGICANNVETNRKHSSFEFRIRSTQ